MKNTISYIYPFTGSFLDYPDNESLCLSIYFLGCDNNCVGCSNPDLKNKNYINNYVVHDEDEKDIIEKIYIDSKRFNTNKISFIGGDPLYKYNIENTKKILSKLKDQFEICIYTGHSITYVRESNIEGFTFVKTNKYIEEYKQESKKTEEYLQFASSNQELYDVNYLLLSSNGRYYFK